MLVTLRFLVEDVETQLDTYESIRVYRSDTLGGAYSAIDTVTLVSGTFYYSYSDSTGDLNKWYKYSYYHATGPVESDLSAPFRVDGVTRLRARQEALSKYGAGVVLVNTGTDANKITTSDHRVKTTLFRDDRGKGTWLWPTSGNNQEKARIILSSDVSAGSMTVLPIWSGNFADGDEVEWHTLADPTVWNDALNRGMARYYYVDRVPLKGVADQEEYDLSSIPWIIDPEGQITDVTWYPTSGLDVEQSYASSGRWWKPRIDRGVATLTIYPPVAATVTLYLYATRPMPPLHTDASAAPAVCVEELVAALAYDEVLAYLTRPRSGGADQRRTWKQQRRDHTPELRRLLWKHRPKPRYGRPRLPQPPVVPQPFRAR
ncbi:hypothetical protein LCGC14_1937040 [marine sediment metagenome]|uniref:Uncharacterized protein n=1 Tax=marine sediment metagenome TaxID=412755 RepID=A0A0F9G9W2_9ZZZZ